MQGRRCAGQPQLLEPSLIQDDPGFTDKCECQCSILWNHDCQAPDPSLSRRETIEAQAVRAAFRTKVTMESITAENDAP